MFSGIIEKIGTVRNITSEGTNKDFWIDVDLGEPVYIDQSIAHNGVCLTVVEIDDKGYKVTAIKETLDKSNIGLLNVGDIVNIERAMKGEMRLDGHIVQGHVDKTIKCIDRKDEDGSWVFTFEIDPEDSPLIVDKGSICINGTSLTVVNPSDSQFSVAIIPYTYEETVFHKINAGTVVNIEFDILGKYIAKYMKRINIENIVSRS